MGILGLVRVLLRTLAAYWELKKERFAHDVIEQSRNKVEVLEDTLEALRDTGTESDAQHADRMRDRLIVERTHLKRISTLYLKTKS